MWRIEKLATVNDNVVAQDAKSLKMGCLTLLPRVGLNLTYYIGAGCSNVPFANA